MFVKMTHFFYLKFSPRFACTPNTSVEPTPEPMKTERNFMRVAGKLSEPSISKPSGRRNTMSGWSAPRVSSHFFPEKAKILRYCSSQPIAKVQNSNFHECFQFLNIKKSCFYLSFSSFGEQDKTFNNISIMHFEDQLAITCHQFTISNSF